MSLIIITRDRFKEEVFGYRDDALRIMKKNRGIVEAQTIKNTRTVFIRARDILLTEVVSEEEEKKLAEQEAAARKRNPNQGRDPILTTVGGRR